MKGFPRDGDLVVRDGVTWLVVQQEGLPAYLVDLDFVQAVPRLRGPAEPVGHWFK